ncbi:putative O-methyltransferase [Lojkania enalia]|uniref:O-methyltransferase n=1 Tax=Lojkania enalia TaxID=147567 RepID=A0A9P4KAE4_9PLEO|nr:putative O-methyltransferase [Didymosphaeria enalia]
MASSAAEPTRISQLATSIQEHTAKVDAYFRSHDLPSPSFDIDLPPDLPAEIRQSQNAILEATDELSDLMLGAQQLAEGFPPRHTSLISIQAISRYDIASKLAIDEEITFTELAERCQLPADDLTRIMRQAISQHIFKEPRKGYIAHTAASRVFIEASELKYWAHIAFDEVWQSTTHLLDALDKWPGSGEPNQAGFNLAKNLNVSFFESMKANKRREKAFANTMSYMQKRQGLGNTTSQLLSAYDWASAKKVVDVGGSLGDTCVDIVREHPSVQCVVQDLPEVITEAEKKASSETASQIKFMAHDFFQEQPVKGADVYLLRWILHDWSDQRAISILRNLIPALKNGANVIVQEFILPEPGMLPSYHEKTIRNMDIAMKAVFNSKERSIEDWKELFEKADPRFIYQSADVPAGSNLAIMRLHWEESK